MTERGASGQQDLEGSEHTEHNSGRDGRQHEGPRSHGSIPIGGLTAASIKHQITNTHQSALTNGSNFNWSLVLGHWDLFDAWCL